MVMASWNPAAVAIPWIGQTTIAGLCRIRDITSAQTLNVSFTSSCEAPARAFRSWPEEKTGPSLRRTMTFGRLARSWAHCDESVSQVRLVLPDSSWSRTDGWNSGRRRSRPVLGEVKSVVSWECRSRSTGRLRALRRVGLLRWRYAAFAGRRGSGMLDLNDIPDFIYCML